MANGTLSIRASVWARWVLPHPVGPMQQDVGLGQLDGSLPEPGAPADSAWIRL